VADDDRKLGHHRKPNRFLLERDAGSGGGGDAEAAAERGANRRGHRGDLVLRLEGDEVEVLVARKLVQDVRGGGDRVTAQKPTQAPEPGDPEKPPRPEPAAGD